MENFENWNKNVRKKNFNDNSNLNSDEITNLNEISNSNQNINSTQRDYNKNPIIIENYMHGKYMIYSMIVVLPLLLLALLIAPVGEKYIRTFMQMLIVIPIMSFVTFSRLDKSKNKYFKLTNSTTNYFSNKNDIKTILTQDIIKVKFARFSVWNRDQKMPIFIYFVFAIWFSLGTFLEGIMVPLTFTLFVVLLFLLTKFLLHIHKGGFKSLRFFDQLVIYENDFKGGRVINILVATNDEYNELREYFLQILNIDIDKVPRTFSVFSK